MPLGPTRSRLYLTKASRGTIPTGRFVPTPSCHDALLPADGTRSDLFVTHRCASQPLAASDLRAPTQLRRCCCFADHHGDAPNRLQVAAPWRDDTDQRTLRRALCASLVWPKEQRRLASAHLGGKMGVLVNVNRDPEERNCL